jgi:hypothetical protein
MGVWGASPKPSADAPSRSVLMRRDASREGPHSHPQSAARGAWRDSDARPGATGRRRQTAVGLVRRLSRRSSSDGVLKSRATCCAAARDAHAAATAARRFSVRAMSTRSSAFSRFRFSSAVGASPSPTGAPTSHYRLIETSVNVMVSLLPRGAD